MFRSWKKSVQTPKSAIILRGMQLQKKSKKGKKKHNHTNRKCRNLFYIEWHIFFSHASRCHFNTDKFLVENGQTKIKKLAISSQRNA